MEALEKTRCNGSDAAQRPFSLVRFVEEIPRKVGLFPIFQEQRRRISLQLRLHGGGRWIRTLSPVSSCWVRYYLSATYGDFIPRPSAAEKRIRLGYAIRVVRFRWRFKGEALAIIGRLGALIEPARPSKQIGRASCRE